MRKLLASLVTASALLQGFVPAYIVDKYTVRKLDMTFRHQFRVMGTSYPYDSKQCVTASREQRRSSRACRGYSAQNSFATTFGA